MVELADERVVVDRSLQRLGISAWLFEDAAGSRPTTIQETYLKELERSDLYIGIFWKRLGKYTLDEFKHAKDNLKIDCLIYQKTLD